MKLWKRNAVVAAIVLFVCAAVYLNWSYDRESSTETGKTLGEATLVGGTMTNGDPLLKTEEARQADLGQDGAAETAETAAGTGYFSATRLNRQQARDSALSLLRQAADESTDTAAAESAEAAIQTMAEQTLAEAQIEDLITAKGYADCVAFIGEESVSIVVAKTAGGLTDTDTARITEIVKEQTGMAASQIKIIEAEP